MKMNLNTIYFCTGARNHDLLKLMDGKDIHFELDERVASFKALGLSKITGSPIGICTTSGTAVSETISKTVSVCPKFHIKTVPCLMFDAVTAGTLPID